MGALLLSGAALVAGFVLLGRGANALVDGGATLARRLGIQPWIVGLTIVAWGTSVPEVVVSTLAALDERPAAALGNVLGSNVANAGLVLGTCALILPTVLAGRIGAVDGVLFVGSLGLVWGALADGEIGRVEGLGMLVLFVLYTASIFRRPRSEVEDADEIAEEARHHRSERPWLAVIIGSVVIAVGARIVLFGAYGLAERFHLSDGLVGLLLLAVGTSLPELAAGVAAARRGHSEIGLGNVIGSNIFNTLAVVGIAAVVAPLVSSGKGRWDLAVARATSVDLPVNLAFSLVLVAAPWLFAGRRGRWGGFLLLGGYLVYVASLTLRVD